MAKRRKSTDRSTDWMRAVVFNSLLILMPVIAAQILASAYAGSGYTERPSPDAIDQTRRNMDDAFAELAPRKSEDRFAFWLDKVARELDEGNVSAARGFLIAGPAMLDKSAARELKAAADVEKLGSEDARLEAAALRKLPVEIANQYELARAAERGNQPGVAATGPVLPAGTPDANPAPAPPQPGVTEPPGPEATPASLSADPQPASPDEATTGGTALINATPHGRDRRFALLGTYADLVDRSKRWVEGDPTDLIELKISGIGLVAAEKAGDTEEARVRAASIVRSARRARRMTPGFTTYLSHRLNAALPDQKLESAVQAALSEMATSDVQIERVKAAYVQSMNPRGLRQLEGDLAQIDRIGTMTSPAAAITLLEHVNDGLDLRRARLIAQAGGDRSMALIEEIGPEALDLADAGVNWSPEVVLKIMGLTAAMLAVFFVVLSSARHNIRRKDRLEDPH